MLPISLWAKKDNRNWCPSPYTVMTPCAQNPRQVCSCPKNEKAGRDGCVSKTCCSFPCAEQAYGGWHGPWYYERGCYYGCPEYYGWAFYGDGWPFYPWKWQ